MSNQAVGNVKARLMMATKVTVLTGAGVSAESGIPTFRGTEGMWQNFRAETLATPEAFAEEPLRVWQWYDWRRGLIAAKSPNAAHIILAAWAKRFPQFRLITQNVDGLHDRAGNHEILKLHGDIWWLRCTVCGEETWDNRSPLPSLPPRCACGHLLRPGVVWFGEGLPTAIWERAAKAAQDCQLFFSIGTSGLVQPAASLPIMAKTSGAYTVEINVERTAISYEMDEVLLGPAAQVLTELGA
ncbi:MAG: NAD-dependent deacylase [Acidobacteria bacterium]|nr:NAD-dependent deacylase [Acidobacteriota bacterium]MBI3658466.1 NAD-dependent deacylase [Acidobacteriota bacterium]